MIWTCTHRVFASAQPASAVLFIMLGLFHLALLLCPWVSCIMGVLHHDVLRFSLVACQCQVGQLLQATLLCIEFCCSFLLRNMASSRSMSAHIQQMYFNTPFEYPVKFWLCLCLPGQDCMALPLTCLCFMLHRWQMLHRRVPMAAVDSSSTLTSSADNMQQARGRQLQNRLLVTLLTVLFYYYPSLLTTTLNLFACYRVDRVDANSAVAYPGNARVRQLQVVLGHRSPDSCC